MFASPGPSDPPVRSSRARIKSQRALESEQTDRLFSRAKAIERERSAASSGVELAAKAPPVKRKNGSKATKKGKGGKVEVYCICKTDGMDERPMIECGECNDW